MRNSWAEMKVLYSLKTYFCLAWQNRRGLWAAMKVSSEVNGVWGGRILNVTTLLEVESFQSGETQVRGTKLFLSLPCAMNKLWSHLQSKKSNGETMEKSNFSWSHPCRPNASSLQGFYGNFCARVSWDPYLLATSVLWVHSSPVLRWMLGTFKGIWKYTFCCSFTENKHSFVPKFLSLWWINSH